MTNVAKRVYEELDGWATVPECFEFSDQDFSQWRALLERRAGLYIAPERRSFLVAGLKTRMREAGASSVAGYYALLRDGVAMAEEWSLLIDTLTVHETRFFRHQSSLSLVTDHVVPDALKRSDTFNAWSVGCATGEEVYSLAMLLDDQCCKSAGQHYFAITGTDISMPALRSARTGVYLNRRLGDIAAHLREKYCKSISNRHFEIDVKLRKRVCFSYLNLRDLRGSPFAGFDLIYCQNLLIYLDRERRLQIANDLAERLQPGGVLILGPGELLHWENPSMEKMRYEDTLAYRRVESTLVTQHERN